MIPPASKSAGTERGRRQGFTLLEVILALSLTALVLVVVAMAIDIHLRVVDVGRTDVEEALLARALLGRIADDLRGAVAYDPMNVEEMVPGLPSVDGLTDEADDLAGEAGLDLSGLESSSVDETTGAPESVLPESVPGLYGGVDWLQVDVSRLPRLDQFAYQVAPAKDSPLIDRLSDVKTVVYFVVPPEEARPGYAADGMQLRGGLVRRELDRAVTAAAGQQGLLEQMDLEVDPVAPEVAAIEFAYYDGTEWADYWDSDEQGGLPVAVQIALVFTAAPRGGRSASGRALSDPGLATEVEPIVYRLLVHLPSARPISGEGPSEGEGESTGDTGSDSPENRPPE